MKLTWDPVVEDLADTFRARRVRHAERMAAGSYNRFPALSLTKHATVTPDDLTLSDISGSATYRWADVQEVRETDRLFVIIVKPPRGQTALVRLGARLFGQDRASKAPAIPLPKRALITPEELDELREVFAKADLIPSASPTQPN